MPKIQFDEFEKINNATVINMDAKMLPYVSNNKTAPITPRKSMAAEASHMERSRKVYRASGSSNGDIDFMLVATP